MSIFNNREIATGIWLAILSIWMLQKEDDRMTFKGVLAAFAAKQILIAVSLMFLYSICMVVLIDAIGLWEWHQVKNFIFWFCFVALVTLFKINEISSNPRFFSESVKSVFKIWVAIQFIVAAHTFNLLIELFFVPFMVFVGGMIAVSEKKEEHKAVNKLLTGMVQLIGLFLILNAIYGLVFNWAAFGKEKTFYDFIVPTLLSLLIMPFFYLLVMHSNFELAYIRIGCFIKDEKLLKYAKLKSLIRFNFRTLKLKRWVDSIAVLDLKSKSDIDHSMDKMFKILKVESNPPSVKYYEGWSPYRAVEFLEDYSLKTGDYKESYDEWYASTPYLELGDEIMPNNIAYYVEGDFEVAKCLRLTLNVNVQESALVAHSTLIDIANELCHKALQAALPSAVIDAISNGENLKTDFRSKFLALEREDFPSGRGYSLKFKIMTS